MDLIEYYPGNSFLHKLDPRVKVILLTCLTMAVFISTNFYVLFATFLALMILWVVAGLPVKKVLSYMKWIVTLTAFITFMQAVFVEGDVALIQPLIPSFVPILGGFGALYLDGILQGLLLGFRLLVVICLMPLMTMTTPVNRLSIALVRLGLNYQIAYIATTALNLIPTLREEATTIMDAQKLRGFTVFEKGNALQKLKAYGPLVIPLVTGSMRRAQMMGVAMDSRAFGAYKKRSYVENIRITPRDIAILCLGLSLCIFIVVLKFILV